ncbi:TRAP transporter small permease [Microbaculum marinum]|uniref:TRAP transporter small permease protein n=1 Tax=Microbaculum marinum TaxID=1764581 RepID=A0AAW9RA55_9HYPH
MDADRRADGRQGAGGDREAVPASFLLGRLVDWMARICGALSTVLLLVILAIVTYAVVRRYVFNAPLLWSDELNGYLLVAMVMLGAAEALRRGDHIAIDLLAGRLAGRHARALEVWGNLAVIVFAAALGWSAWGSISFAYDFGSYSSGHLEMAMWIPMLPVLAGSVLLMLAAAVRVVDALAGQGRA